LSGNGYLFSRPHLLTRLGVVGALVLSACDRAPPPCTPREVIESQRPAACPITDGNGNTAVRR
jgi:hypothetical protein